MGPQERMNLVKDLVIGDLLFYGSLFIVGYLLWEMLKANVLKPLYNKVFVRIQTIGTSEYVAGDKVLLDLGADGYAEDEILSVGYLTTISRHIYRFRVTGVTGRWHDGRMIVKKLY